MRMYDYTEQFIQLESLLARGEIDEQVYQDTLKAIEGDAFEKAENVAKMIDNFKATSKMLKEEEDKLKKKRKTIENSIEWLTHSLEAFLTSTGKEELHVGMYRLGYRNLPAKVEVIDENKVPDAYKTYTVKVDKRSLAKVLKDGEKIDGVELVTGRTKFEVKK